MNLGFVLHLVLCLLGCLGFVLGFDGFMMCSLARGLCVDIVKFHVVGFAV